MEYYDILKNHEVFRSREKHLSLMRFQSVAHWPKKELPNWPFREYGLTSACMSLGCISNKVLCKLKDMATGAKVGEGAREGAKPGTKNDEVKMMRDTTDKVLAISMLYYGNPEYVAYQVMIEAATSPVRVAHVNFVRKCRSMEENASWELSQMKGEWHITLKDIIRVLYDRRVLEKTGMLREFGPSELANLAKDNPEATYFSFLAETFFKLVFSLVFHRARHAITYYHYGAYDVNDAFKQVYIYRYIYM